MNNHGHVCGYYDDCEESALDHAFYWAPETGLVTLPEPEWAYGAVATDINDEGLVCGYYRLPSFIHTRAFVHDIKTGAFQHLEPLQEGGSTGANAINNNGVIAGWRSIGKSGNNPYNAMIWDTNTGEVTDLGVMNGPNSSAWGISRNGDSVTGWTGSFPNLLQPTVPFRYHNQSLELLAPVPDGTWSLGYGINDAGNVCGMGRIVQNINAPIYGAIWSPELAVISPVSGFVSVGLHDLNNVGQAVGSAANSSGASVVVLWQYGEFHASQDLVQLSPDVTLTLGRAINNQGQILAGGLFNGSNIAFLLTPDLINAADLNFDCEVNAHDAMFLLEQWGPATRSAGTGPSADLNGDGVINVFDLLMLLANWE